MLLKKFLRAKKGEKGLQSKLLFVFLPYDVK